MITIKDFKVGEKAFLLINKKGNVGRYIKSNDVEDYIKEVTVIKIGKRNVYVDYLDMSFSQKDYAVGLVQNTDVCANYFCFRIKSPLLKMKKKNSLLMN